MFTPQKKGWAGWSLSPRVGDGPDGGSAPVNARSAGGLSLGKGKGKGKSVVEALPPPPQASLGENGNDAAGGAGDVEVWRRFREAGLLDESVLQKKEKEALVQRISELETELHEYQYNMGLLLIEKKEWTCKYEEIRQGLAEAEEILKREQAAHTIAVSEYEKQKENLQKALGVEKQCVADLEKALREMRGEIAEAKYTSDKKLAEAHALEANLEEKYLEIEGKLHSADAKLAEASRKSSEVDRKLDDVEARERKLQKEYLSLNTERKTYKKDLDEQREHLREWEKNLQESQKRLLEGQRSINDREERANETDRLLKKKEEELEEARKMIEVTKNSLKEKEDDISNRQKALISKEKESSIKIENVEKKEKELLAIEEKLNAREKVEMQKLLDDHTEALNSKKQEFELDLERRRKFFDEEIKGKLDAVDKKKIEIDRKEEQVTKREREVENKMQSLKQKEKDFDTKSKALKKWEESIKIDQKKLEEEKQQLDRELQDLCKSRNELENLKATVEEAKQQMIKEEEKLELTKEEREQHLLLQTKLKQEIEDCRIIKESLLKEREDLRELRENFEKEWDVLDEKKVELEAEVKKVNDERERFEKWRFSEEERLNNEVLEAKAGIQRELEELRLKKETFDSTMELEKSNASEELKRGHADIARELELRKHELEMDMQKKHEDMEKQLQEKENQFNRWRDRELNQINSLKNLNESKIQKLKVEQDQLEREKEEFSEHRKKLESDQLEIQNDIETLRMLSRNLKDQREQFTKEKERFLAFAEQYKVCKNCGVTMSDLELLQLGSDDAGDVQLPSLALEEHLKGKNAEISPTGTGLRSVISGGRMSWLQKCSRLFNFSPGKKEEKLSECQAEKSLSFGARLDGEASEGEANYEPGPSYVVGNDTIDAQRVQSDSGVRENEESERLVEAGDGPEPSFGIADNSTDIQVESEQIIPPIDERNEREESSLPPENEFQPEPLKQRRRLPNRKGRPKATRRTRSVKAVVEDAKAILGETSEEKNDGPPNGVTRDSLNIQEESQGDSVHADAVATSSRQKRRLAQTSGMTAGELEADDSETRSESISLGGRRKRRQISAPGTQAPGEKRYNFRRSTIAGTVAAAQTMPDQTKEHKTGSHQQSTENEVLKGGSDGEGTSKRVPAAEPSSGIVGENKKTSHMLQRTTVGSAEEVHENSQKLALVEETHANESDCDIIVKSMDCSEQSGEDGIVVDGAAGASEPATPDGGCGSEDDYDEDEEDSEKHDASIGKKLWTFFTT
ncbi:nuclear matrix constituent protein 1 isoform X1 [Elaeis guineensis]|uniref:Protein CROWDED NUCLEI 1 n=1 Tax=Elaeis guineensis var. tenera TaxID=51953 RepID=A0A6J0PQL1_ELAGV|nr:protein CROWDED NUCLEI 1 [Elaeis guineensis]